MRIPPTLASAAIENSHPAAVAAAAIDPVAVEIPVAPSTISMLPAFKCLVETGMPNAQRLERALC